MKTIGHMLAATLAVLGLHFGMVAVQDAALERAASITTPITDGAKDGFAAINSQKAALAELEAAYDEVNG